MSPLLRPEEILAAMTPEERAYTSAENVVAVLAAIARIYHSRMES